VSICFALNDDELEMMGSTGLAWEGEERSI